MSNVIPFPRRLHVSETPIEPMEEYFTIEARDNYPGAANKHMRAYWIELSDGFVGSKITIPWQGDSYEDARRAAAEMAEPHDIVVDNVRGAQ